MSSSSFKAHVPIPSSRVFSLEQYPSEGELTHHWIQQPLQDGNLEEIIRVPQDQYGQCERNLENKCPAQRAKAGAELELCLQAVERSGAEKGKDEEQWGLGRWGRTLAIRKGECPGKLGGKPTAPWLAHKGSDPDPGATLPWQWLPAVSFSVSNIRRVVSFTSIRSQCKCLSHPEASIDDLLECAECTSTGSHLAKLGAR
ncbi:hypothetical protein I79_007303 [Cricetulus griseus]|nr:hypothetical protein I79_007303 [Cricetulus griseus]